METLRFPLEKAVADHRTRLNMIAGTLSGPHPGLDEQFREASAELLSVDVQAFLEPFYRQQVAVVATEAEKVKRLSEVHLTFIKFARDIVQQEAVWDGADERDFRTHRLDHFDSRRANDGMLDLANDSAHNRKDDR